MKNDQIRSFLDEVTSWATAQPDILAITLVGSYARNAAHETSNIDLVIISTCPDQYIEHTDWIHKFGVAEKQQIEEYGLLTSLRVWYMDGREIEFGITDEQWAAIPLDTGSQRVISDGIRILFEKDQILSWFL